MLLGWQEWIALPDLGLAALKAKIDTGARTSALHMSSVTSVSSSRIRFVVHPVPGRADLAITCSAPLAGERSVISSNGERETRYVITSTLALAGRQWPIELTLTNRETMRARMLLGRQALRQAIRIDPARTFLQPRLAYKLYPGYRPGKRTR
jgi:ribosomal protein S6--L-glutamate ligase